MNVWQAEYIYNGKKAGMHVFTSTTQFSDGGPMEFAEKELEKYIKEENIIKQN